MNRIGITPGAATRRSLGISLLAALLLTLGAAVPAILAAISCPGDVDPMPAPAVIVSAKSR